MRLDHGKITIFNIVGEVVTNLINTHQKSGYKSIQWNATNDKGQPVPSGFYFYTIQAGDYKKTNKMLLLK